jgi:hypothetical protein
MGCQEAVGASREAPEVLIMSEAEAALARESAAAINITWRIVSANESVTIA